MDLIWIKAARWPRWYFATGPRYTMPEHAMSERRPQAETPAPPKACPVCRVAMQLRSDGDDLVHHCKRCDLTVTIAAAKNGK